MNGLNESLSEIEAMVEAYDESLQAITDMMVCVPATLLQSVSDTVGGSPVKTGGQDCHFNESGAHTGDISAEMIADCGGTAVIVGHSERRTDHNESDALVKSKARAGVRAGLLTIVCIGETETERTTGKTLEVLKSQLDGSMPDNSKASEIIVAYEPVWAIGTGLVPSAEDVAEAHAFIREYLTTRFTDEGARMRLLYGGSVKASNAVELMGILNVDGALVGGASLKAADFVGICNAYAELA